MTSVIRCMVACIPIGFLVSVGSATAEVNNEVVAHYTKIESGEDFERYSRTGPFADIAVEVGAGQLCFWRGSSYLPYWETEAGRWYLDELVPRSGDGTSRRPDRVNRFSRVMLIESNPERAVVQWRYLPVFSPGRPPGGVDPTGFVEEYFIVHANGTVERSVKQGTDRIDDWNDPDNRIQQTLRLEKDGLEIVSVEGPTRTEEASDGPIVVSSPSSAPTSDGPVLWWKFDEATGDQTTEAVSGMKSTIVGHKALWRPGVNGSSLQFDGYNTEVRLPAGAAPKAASHLTVESWVAVAAYPWNWAPVVQQTDDKPVQLEKSAGNEVFLANKIDESEGQDEHDGGPGAVDGDDEDELDEELGDLEFEGDTSLVVTGAEDFDLTNSSYTVVAKIRTNNGGTIFAHAPEHGEHSEDAKSLYIEEGSLQFDIGFVGVVVAEADVADGQWHYVAIEYDSDSGVVKLYVDEQEVATDQLSPSGAELEEPVFRIGFTTPDFPDSVRGFEGEIPRLAFYQRLLTTEELKSFANGSTPSEGLVAHWDRFDHEADRFLDSKGGHHANMEEVEVWGADDANTTGGDEQEEEDDDDEFSFRLQPEDDRGFFLGIDGLGHVGFKLRVAGTWHEVVSSEVLPLRTWKHIAGIYNGESGEIQLLIDGAQVATKSTHGGPIELSEQDVVLGRGKPRRPVNPVRRNTFVDSYSFDGLIDEVRVHDRALSDKEIVAVHQELEPTHGTPLQPRSLPSGPDSDQFGAHYTHLRFYEAWDNLWRFGDHPDVVVTFDKSPCRFVFWRGCGYIPMLVNDEGHWYSNEFNETWGTSGGQGCQEPMSDKESYTNHVRIIENTDARVVVHWRYPLVDVLHVAANYDDDTGWADWSDWYYYIYPDGVAAKTMHLWTDGERNHEWQESMAIMGPNQHPEQVLETAPAISLVGVDGNVTEYDWVEGPPTDIDVTDKHIQIVNYKSAYDPFTIGDFQGGDVYGGELTDYAVFPSWNHWPVAQMPSDGRYASYPDRTSHSSLTHVQVPTYQASYGDRPYEQRLLLEGMSDATTEQLVRLAKSWLRPPELTIESGGAKGRYEPGQRAYLLDSTGGDIVLTLNATENQPVVNPCLVISNWGDAPVNVEIAGIDHAEDTDVRIGRTRTVDTHDLVVWIETESNSPVRISLVR